MIKFLLRLSNYYYRSFKSPESYARHIGVNIGKNCLIGTRFWSSEPYLITIGNNVQVTDNVHFYTHGGGHIIRQIYHNYDAFGKITVCDNVYIGSNSLIMPGITIGKGALVAAGSVVTKSVSPGTVVGGNPARVICSVEDYINRNLKYDVGVKGLSDEGKRAYLMNLDDSKFIIK